MSVQELIDALKPIAAVSPNYRVDIRPYREVIQWKGCGSDECYGEEAILSGMFPTRVFRDTQHKCVTISTQESP